MIAVYRSAYGLSHGVRQNLDDVEAASRAVEGLKKYYGKDYVSHLVIKGDKVVSL